MRKQGRAEACACVVIAEVWVSPSHAPRVSPSHPTPAYPPSTPLPFHTHCSPDFSELVTASSDGTAKVWDFGTGQVLRTLRCVGRGWGVGCGNTC
jgi:WD40 repeat protein